MRYSNLIIAVLILVATVACHGGPDVVDNPPSNTSPPASGSSGGASGNIGAPVPGTPGTDGTTPASGQACSGPDLRRGFNFVCWYRGCFEEAQTDGALDAMREHGANWLVIVPTWYQDSPSSNAIYEHTSRSPSTSELRAVIASAKDKGFHILLKPHIDIIGGAWRGTIAPSNLASWQQSYRDFMLHFASLADDAGVDALAIGTELKARSSDTAFWRDLIIRVNAAYGGLTTYAANWDEYPRVLFWDMLDFIGIDFYFPITDDTRANEEEMVDSLTEIGQTLMAFSEEEGRPFLLTEIGYRNVDGTTMRPYDSNASGAIDDREQADAYHAVLSTYQGASWLEGIFWWRWDPRYLDGSDEGYLIFEKPAADVVKEFWAGVTCD